MIAIMVEKGMDWKNVVVPATTKPAAAAAPAAPSPPSPVQPSQPAQPTDAKPPPSGQCVLILLDSLTDSHNYINFISSFRVTAFC